MTNNEFINVNQICYLRQSYAHIVACFPIGNSEKYTKLIQSHASVCVDLMLLVWLVSFLNSKFTFHVIA